VESNNNKGEAHEDKESAAAVGDVHNDGSERSGNACAVLSAFAIFSVQGKRMREQSDRQHQLRRVRPRIPIMMCRPEVMRGLHGTGSYGDNRGPPEEEEVQWPRR